MGELDKEKYTHPHPCNREKQENCWRLRRRRL